MASPRSFIATFCLAALTALPLCAAQDSGLQLCLQTAGVPVIGPSNATFAFNSQAWSARIKTKPAVITIPESRDQVAAALACGREAKVKMSALCGNHSFAGFGFGNDGNLVIDMASFQDMNYDPLTELFTYGGGVRVGPGVTYLWNTAGRHIPHVRHARPGLAGSSIGAGFGSTSRLFGTPMDNIVSVEYMLSNGTIVEASADSNPDLLWAAKGAGSSFGILLSLTTKTYAPLFDTAMNFTLTFSEVSVPIAAAAYMSVQDYVLSGKAPDEIAIRCGLPSSGFKKMSWPGFYYGDPSTFASAIAPLLATLPNTTVLTQSTFPFFTSEGFVAAGLTLPAGGSSPARSFYTQALTTTADDPFTLPLLTTLLTSLQSFNRSDLATSGFLDLWGGVVRDISDSDSAHAHGNNLWLVRLDGNTSPATAPFPADGVEYMKNLMVPFEKALVEAEIPLRGFANYRDTALVVEEWSQRLYGDNWEKLLEVKREYDPEGWFTSNSQSIPVV